MLTQGCLTDPQSLSNFFFISWCVERFAADLRFESCCPPELVTPHEFKGNNIPKHCSSVAGKKAGDRDMLYKVCLFPAQGYAVAYSPNYRN